MGQSSETHISFPAFGPSASEMAKWSEKQQSIEFSTPRVGKGYQKSHSFSTGEWSTPRTGKFSDFRKSHSALAWTPRMEGKGKSGSPGENNAFGHQRCFDWNRKPDGCSEPCPNG